jgi:hypothetical protein
MDHVEEEERHPYLPNMNYETDIVTADFIYFVQDYSQFLHLCTFKTPILEDKKICKM